ncbi:MAG: mitochondrial fission ELM1 family protein [Kiritimatiellae bacterium]|nr:mitochondrial fission ELM1 family protein [Kiritimatiellia bacterium]
MERKVLILTDGKAGHENQSKAFARALGCDFDLVEIHFKSAFHKTLSYLFDRLGIHTLSLFANHEPRTTNHAYAAVLGTGSGTFYAAKSLARKTGVKCGVVLYPRGYRIATFDCVLAPAFDRPHPAPNVITIPVNLVASDEAFYAAGTEAFRARYTPSNKPAVAVIVGGPNKCSTMSADWMRAQLDQIFATYKPTNHEPRTTNHEIWVTTSRRTPPEVEAVVDSFPFDYKLLYSKDHFNPIPAFVKLARTLYVTAESTGMISESCTFGAAEVRVLDNLKPGPHKFRRFVEDLARGGYVNGTRKVDLSEQFAHARELLEMKELSDRASERTRNERRSENL